MNLVLHMNIVKIIFYNKIRANLFLKDSIMIMFKIKIFYEGVEFL